MPNIEVRDIIATLLTNGFNIDKVERFANNSTIINANKFDRLGAKVSYSFLFTDEIEECNIVDTLVHYAENYNATPLLIGDQIKTDKCTVYSRQSFFSFFGGIINSGLVLVPNLKEILNALGHNSLPSELKGKPDDLHEMYTRECLQFIMSSPSRRYGIERRFAPVPDSVILSNEHFILLVDSKAYSKGFEFTADDIKRFSSYVVDFRQRYSAYFGEIFSFVVVSGHFNDSGESITNRSAELYKLCGCKISCITSSQLGSITELLRNDETFRVSIIWRNIFSEIILDNAAIEKEISRIKKDNIK